MRKDYAPENEGHMLQVRNYIEHDPEADYTHASQDARQAFQDMKYGVRIHWGLYSPVEIEERVVEVPEDVPTAPAGLPAAT